ncbi:uncharacterized protein LOC119684845 isoform X2 [Teleopsis dalmanni]|nr:uncharacterized protein LOC119684845 isoform X2 [Teleopsis dalmanni]
MESEKKMLLSLKKELNPNVTIDGQIAYTVPYILNGSLFRILTQEGENVTVKCCNCPEDRIYRGSLRSTGNFHMHIKRRHPNLMSTLEKMKIDAVLERRHCQSKKRNAQTIDNKSKVKKLKEGSEKDSVSSSSQRTLKIKKVYRRHQQEALRNESTAINFANQSVEDTQRKNDDGQKVQIAIKPERNNTTVPLNLSVRTDEQSEVAPRGSQDKNALIGVSTSSAPQQDTIEEAEANTEAHNTNDDTTETPIAASSEITNLLNLIYYKILDVMRGEYRSYDAGHNNVTTQGIAANPSIGNSPYNFDIGYVTSSNIAITLDKIKTDLGNLSHTFQLLQNEIRLQNLIYSYLLCFQNNNSNMR